MNELLPLYILCGIIVILFLIVFGTVAYTLSSDPDSKVTSSPDYIHERDLFIKASSGNTQPLREYLKTLVMVPDERCGPEPWTTYRSKGGYISCRYSYFIHVISRGATSYDQSFKKEPQAYGFTEEEGSEFTDLVGNAIKRIKIKH